MVDTDFDIAKQIVEKLKGQDIPFQERVLRWVKESLGLKQDSFPVVATSAQPNPRITASIPVSGIQDIRSFAKEKNPSSAMQTAAVIAFYYKFVVPSSERKETITKEIFVDALRLIRGIPIPKKPAQTLIDAKAYGYLDFVGRGEYEINSVGENLVAMTLGDGNSSSSAVKTKKKISKKKTDKKTSKQVKTKKKSR